MTKFCVFFRSILVCSLFSLSYTSNAQERIYRRFNTQNVRASTIKDFPEYGKNLGFLENTIAAYASKGDDNRIYRVPVIFHVLSSEGKQAPDEAQVRFQLEVLNKCFGSYAPEKKPYTNEALEKFEPMGVSPGIQFYIPETFEGVKGINFAKAGKTSFGLTNQIQNPKFGGLAPVKPTNVINIWIGELDSTNAGYAHLPGAPGEVDGIVIDPDFFGNEKGTAKAPYTQGKTLVHLMGTYLGLNELWNEKDPCADDGVADTPPHHAPSERIRKDAGYKYITMCRGYILAMYMNFMDNTDDEMLTLFTPGQKMRMRAMLAEGGLRSELPTK